MTISIAIGVTHLPGNPAREASMSRLREACHVGTFLPLPIEWNEFTDREPVWSWHGRMIAAGIASRAEFALFFCDDTILAPRWYEMIQAMLANLPRRAVLGLAAQHPRAPDLAAIGHRWYRTRSWVVGWAYGMWRDDLIEFNAWRRMQPADTVRARGDDNIVNDFVSDTKRHTWHPLPTIADHDFSIESTFGRGCDEANRSSWTWRDVSVEARQKMLSPRYWEPGTLGEEDERLAAPLLDVTSEEERNGLKDGYWKS